MLRGENKSGNFTTSTSSSATTTGRLESFVKEAFCRIWWEKIFRGGTDKLALSVVEKLWGILGGENRCTPLDVLAPSLTDNLKNTLWDIYDEKSI